MKLQNNIPKLYVLHAAQHALVYLPVWILFLQDRGLTLSMVFLLDSVRSLTFILLEIPSGMLSDTWGRKRTLIVSSCCGILSMLFFGFGDSLLHYFAAAIFSGLFVSFHSGTMEAFTYDTLQATGEQEKSIGIFSKQQTLQSATQAFASIAGGVLAAWHLQMAILGTLPFMILALFVTLTLVEPPHVQQESIQLPLWKRCMSLFRERPAIIGILVFHGAFGGFIMWLSRSTQPYLSLLALPTVFIGFFYALLDFSIGGGSAVVPRCVRSIGKYSLLIVAAMLAVLSAIGLGTPVSLWGCLLLLLAHISWGIIKPVTADIISGMTSIDIRATVLSMRSLGFHFSYALIAFPLSVVAEASALPHTFFAAGICGLVLLLLFVSLFRGAHNDIN